MANEQTQQTMAENLAGILSVDPEKTYWDISNVITRFTTAFSLKQSSGRDLETLPKDRRLDITFNYEKEFVDQYEQPAVSLLFTHSVAGYRIDLKDTKNNQRLFAFRYGVSGNAPKVEAIQ